MAESPFWPKFPNYRKTTWGRKMRFTEENENELKIYNTLHWKKNHPPIHFLPSKTSEILRTTLRSGAGRIKIRMAPYTSRPLASSSLSKSSKWPPGYIILTFSSMLFVCFADRKYLSPSLWLLFLIKPFLLREQCIRICGIAIILFETQFSIYMCILLY